MQLGAFGKIYKRETVEEVFEAVAGDGLTCVQFNMESVGLPPMPDRIDPETTRRIRDAAAANGVAITALSGTFNMIHPDPHVRATGLQRLEVLAASCGAIGTEIITVCTGTRDSENMWRRHPMNDTADAWRDLTALMSVALGIADRYDVKLAFEPEPGNVITTPERGRRLIEEMASTRLEVVIDAANLADEGDEERLPAVLEVAFDLLGDRILFAHAKDRAHGGEVVPAGQGAVPWDRYIQLLAAVNPAMTLIMHGLAEADVPGAAAFLQARMT